jgi:hypothetical protein
MQKRRWVHAGIALFLLALFITLLQSLSAAQPTQPTGWQVVGQIGGPTSAVAVQGNYAYVGVGLQLVVLDVTNPVTPSEVGATAPFPYFVEDIAASGTMGYVAAGGAGLRVVDISDPANPIELGAWDSPGYAEGVAVAGDSAYLADGPYGLWTIDVADPTNPKPVGSLYDMNYAFEAVVSGNYAYIAAAGAGLLVADVSDPAHPVEVGALDTPGYAQGIAVAGEIAYIADAWEGLQIADVSDPANPSSVSALKTLGWAFGVTISGTQAYVADAFGGLGVIDVSDINHPQELGGYDLWRGHAGSVAINGNIAYVADRTWGLRVADISDPAHPTEVGAYSPMGFADAVVVAGNLAYVAAGGYGLRIIDLTDIGHPREVGAAALPDPADTYATAVAVMDGYAYVGVGGWLYLADVSDPARPIWTEKVSVQEVRDMTVAGTVAYVADASGLQLVSLSDPAHPVLLGRIPLPGAKGNTVGVAVSGTLAYVASEGEGFSVVDVSNPNKPTLVGSAPIFAVDVDVAGGWAYIVDRAGLSVVDISDPVEPRKVSFLETEGDAGRVTVSGTTAYVSDGGRGLVVIDVSDPYHPVFVAEVNTQGCSLDATLASDRVFVADGPNGLVIAQASPPGDAIPAKAKARASSLSFPSVTLAPRASSGRAIGREGTTTSTITVTGPLDSGPSTLRQALLDAGAGDTIAFDPAVFPPAAPVTISLDSDLPPVTQGDLTIDGSDAGVILDGHNVPVWPSWPYAWAQGGLTLASNGNTVMGLQIVRFPGHGVLVQGDSNVIGGDRNQGGGPLGQGNLVSGNGIHGISIGDHQNNVVVGNLIGTDLTGTREFGNGVCGVGIAGSGVGNRIGGTRARDRNIISGNAYSGVTMQDSFGNTILGNYVGTDVSGSAQLGNHGYGISMEVGSFNNVVQGNLSSGNEAFGIMILNWGSNYNTVIGNRIGTDASGMEAIPNNTGVLVGDGASFNRVGGRGPGEANLISGNSYSGITLEAGVGPGNLAIGNLVGTTIDGGAALGNAILSGGSAGISLRAYDVVTLVEDNLASGNYGRGILLAGDYNFAIGNHIGTDVTLSRPLPNTAAGIYVRGEHNLVQDNLAAHSLTGPGIEVYLWSHNTIRRNSIFSNEGPGIELTDGGNQMLPAPAILTVNETTVSGTACPGCTVEIFSDDEDEGRVYEGMAIADALGEFTFDKGSPLAGPYLTATATDSAGNTSEFSAPAARPVKVYLPLVLKSR